MRKAHFIRAGIVGVITGITTLVIASISYKEGYGREVAERHEHFHAGHKEGFERGVKDGMVQGALRKNPTAPPPTDFEIFDDKPPAPLVEGPPSDEFPPFEAQTEGLSDGE